MPPDDASLDRYIAETARLLDLPLDPAWVAAIRANLKVTLGHGEAVAGFPLHDEAEPAPVYCP